MKNLFAMTPASLKSLALLLVLLLLAAGARAQLFPNLGGQRVGISALTFLKNDLSPRSTAMGEANISMDGDGYAPFTNPALAVDNEMMTFTSSNLFYTAGLNQVAATAIFPNDNSGAWFGSLTNLSSGEMEVRTVFQPEGTGQTFRANNLAAGLGYAQSLSEMFSFGIQLRYINETIAEYTAHAVAADLGFQYRTDFRDLNFAVLIQNFGPNSTTSGEGQALRAAFNPQSDGSTGDFSPPTIFKLGFSITAWEQGVHQLSGTGQLNHPIDNAENLRFGAEYTYDELLSFRAGYKVNVDGERFPTAGLGVDYIIGRHPIRLEYGVNPTEYLGTFHTVGLTFQLNRIQQKRQGNSGADDFPETGETPIEE